MNPVRIVPPKGMAGHGTKVLLEDGSQVPMIGSININIEPGSVITAEMEIVVAFEEITAHPMLGLATVRRAAAAWGYDLVKRKDA